MPRAAPKIYVSLLQQGVGVLTKIDSTDKRGKYAVLVKGGELQHFPEIKQRITQTQYDEYQPEQPKTKQPTKRSKKS